MNNTSALKLLWGEESTTECGTVLPELTRMIDFRSVKLAREDVLAQIQIPGKDAFAESINGILEQYEKVLAPFACYRTFRVSHMSRDVVLLDGRVLEDSYLAHRLKYTDRVNVFYLRVNNQLWNISKKITDSVDHLLLDYIMLTSLNLAFESTICELLKGMPRGYKVHMDNPGVARGWKLDRQKELLELLFEMPTGMISEISFNGKFMENAYSMTGIVYSNSLYHARKKNAVFMENRELAIELFREAGFR